MQSLSGKFRLARPCTAHPAPFTRCPSLYQHAQQNRRQRVRAADVSPSGDSSNASQQQQEGEQQQPYQQDYKPFPRARDSNPYRLLGVSKDADFEEVQDARNYLWERYKWHEPSREAVELAFDTVIKEKLKVRHREGFMPVLTGRKGRRLPNPRASSLWRKIEGMFDPTVTTTKIINDGAVFGAFALWALFSADQSFPLAAAFIYSVYQFQQKRIKRDPEGPFFLGNPMAGAVITTVLNCALACAVLTVATAPVAALLGGSVRQVGAMLVILVVGLLNVYIK